MIYIDNAATSWPKPEAVYKELDDFARNWAANPGRSGYRMAIETILSLLRGEPPESVLNPKGIPRWRQRLETRLS